MIPENREKRDDLKFSSKVEIMFSSGRGVWHPSTEEGKLERMAEWSEKKRLNERKELTMCYLDAGELKKHYLQLFRDLTYGDNTYMGAIKLLKLEKGGFGLKR